MKRRGPLGPDPLATVTFAGVALIVSAAFLGAARIDGESIGFIEGAVVLTPLIILGVYVITQVERRPGPDRALQEAAVRILTAEIDDPTTPIDPRLSEAAADLLVAIGASSRDAAENRLRRALSRSTNRSAIRPSG